MNKNASITIEISNSTEDPVDVMSVLENLPLPEGDFLKGMAFIEFQKPKVIVKNSEGIVTQAQQNIEIKSKFDDFGLNRLILGMRVKAKRFAKKNKCVLTLKLL